jgi:hypothetical protein
MGTFQTAELIETFVNYHENIKKCVCLIYDPQRSQRGSLGLRAVRLKDSFINLYKQEKLSGKELREANISWKDVFVDVPVKVRGGRETHARTRTHTHTHTHTHARTHTLNNTQIHALALNSMHMHALIRTCARSRACVHACDTHTHTLSLTRTHTHNYTHMHTHTGPKLSPSPSLGS